MENIVYTDWWLLIPLFQSFSHTFCLTESQKELGLEMQPSTLLGEVMLPSVWWSQLPMFLYIPKTSKGIKLVLEVVNQAAYSHHIHSSSLNTICQFLKWGGNCCLPSLESWSLSLERNSGEPNRKGYDIHNNKIPWFLKLWQKSNCGAQNILN